jgi:hypothetical protein
MINIIMKKYLILICLLAEVNCYLVNRIIINKKNVIVKETYNGNFIQNYKYSNKYNKKNLKLKYNYLDNDK